jgi:hypothetical protein
MDPELEVSSGTAAEGGVGNGQATGTGQVSENFDMAGAVDSISDGLGFGETVNEEVAAPAVPAVKPAPATFDAATGKPVVAPAAPAAPVVPAAVTDVAPKTWKADEAAVWAAIPPEAKAAIARREEDMFRGIEQHKATASFGNTVQRVLDPYMPILKAHGIDPVQNIGNLMQAHYLLATGSPAQKQQMFEQLAKDYNINLAPQVDDPYAPVADPRIAAMEQELQQLRSGQAQQQQQALQQTKVQTESAVNAFAADPANAHFEEVAEEMAQMLSVDKALTLEKAYERAVWSNPVTRAKEIARQDAEKQTKAREEAAAKLAESRKASGANVRVQPKAGAATMPLGTMDDTMAETMAMIKNR